MRTNSVFMGFSATLDTVSISFNSFFWMTIFRFFLLWHFQQSSWKRTLTYPHFAFIGYNHGFRFFKFHGFNHGCFLEVTPIRFVTQKQFHKQIYYTEIICTSQILYAVRELFYDSSGKFTCPCSHTLPLKRRPTAGSPSRSMLLIATFKFRSLQHRVRICTFSPVSPLVTSFISAI